MADGCHIENRFFWLSKIYRPLNAKFGKKKHRQVRIGYRLNDQNTIFRKFKMADGRHLKCFFRYSSAKNHPFSTKFGSQMQILVPITAISQNIKNLQIQHGRRPPY